MVFDMPAWNESYIKWFMGRTSLFVRRGLTQAQAESTADRLAFRDFEGDDRSMCLECSSLQRGGRCFEVQKGNMRGVSPRHEPVQNVLQRCSHFNFQTL